VAAKQVRNGGGQPSIEEQPAPGPGLKRQRKQQQPAAALAGDALDARHHDPAPAAKRGKQNGGALNGRRRVSSSGDEESE
jgi:hypothetical protein